MIVLLLLFHHLDDNAVTGADSALVNNSVLFPVVQAAGQNIGCDFSSGIQKFLKCLLSERQYPE
jgi:hypothetical protein